MSIKIHLVFIVPQSLPKLFKEYYKNYEYKDYGIGKYKPLLDYFKDIKEYKESTDSQDQSLSITHTRVFLSPYKANKLNFAFALGYSFLHRPLGLIMWYQWSYEKELEQMETNLRRVRTDKDKFLELYHNFYEKENIDKRNKEIEKELLYYIDHLEIDLLATTFLD